MALRLGALALTAALAGPLAATAAVAPAQTFSADYSVSFLGLTVARSTFTSRIGNDRYDISGSMHSAGLASVFADTSGRSSASGRISGGRLSPESYSVSYVYGDKSRKTSVQFSSGKVVKVATSPAPPKRRADWVPVTAAELSAVMDPLSSSLVKARDLRSVCDHSIRAFTGEIRANLRLSFVATVPISIQGYDGEGVTCAATLKPVAGYHRSNRSMRYASTSRITVTFAELGKTGIYAPVQASVGTAMGPVSVHASRLVASQ